MTKRNAICSIGSGERVRKYKSFLQERVNLGLHDRMLQAEIMNPRGFAKTLGFFMSHSINKYPEEEISPNLHILTVNKGGMSIQANNITSHSATGEVEVLAKMPKVACTYHDFSIMVNLVGAAAACAIC